MNEILHANIFFVIASVAVVAFSIIVCFILYQVFKIIKLVRAILERVESASELVAADIATMREAVKNGGVASRVISFVLGFVGGKRRK